MDLLTFSFCLKIQLISNYERGVVMLAYMLASYPSFLMTRYTLKLNVLWKKRKQYLDILVYMSHTTI